VSENQALNFRKTNPMAIMKNPEIK